MFSIGRSLRLWSPLGRERRRGERKEEKKALREKENRRGKVHEMRGKESTSLFNQEWSRMITASCDNVKNSSSRATTS